MSKWLIVKYYRSDLRNAGYSMSNPAWPDGYTHWYFNHDYHTRKRKFRVPSNFKVTELMQTVIWASRYDDVNLLKRVIKNLRFDHV